MNIERRFSNELRSKPFQSYSEYMDYIFACVNFRLSDYIDGLKGKYDEGQGNYKNVMYPDIEIAYDLCNDKMLEFAYGDDSSDEASTGESDVDA